LNGKDHHTASDAWAHQPHRATGGAYVKKRASPHRRSGIL